ncbi:hypothetical protein BH11BAC3_BH11BAC3_47240 [soil metagenome]
MTEFKALRKEKSGNCFTNSKQIEEWVFAAFFSMRLLLLSRVIPLMILLIS